MYLSNGNSKMSFATFSLPSTVTCPGATCMCQKKCYAKKAERMYPKTRNSRKENLIDSQSETFVEKMIDYINNHKRINKQKIVRLHESGDFYNQKYLNKWIAICKNFPDIKFLAFTKSFHLDFSKVPKNLVIVYSIFPDTKKETIPSKGKFSYAGFKPEGEKLFVCPGHCDNCQKCWNIKHSVYKGVYFKFH